MSYCFLSSEAARDAETLQDRGASLPMSICRAPRGNRRGERRGPRVSGWSLASVLSDRETPDLRHGVPIDAQRCATRRRAKITSSSSGGRPASRCSAPQASMRASASWRQVHRPGTAGTHGRVGSDDVEDPRRGRRASVLAAKPIENGCEGVAYDRLRELARRVVGTGSAPLLVGL